MPSSKPRRRFQDIIDNIGRIRDYTAGMDENSFAAGGMAADAVERCLGRISEAAVKLGQDAEKYAAGIPWQQIRSMGNRLRHEYDALQFPTLWSIILHELGPLEAACILALKDLPDDERVG